MPQTPGEGYPATSRYQPDELPLEMTVDQLKTVEEAAIRVESKPGTQIHFGDIFEILNLATIWVIKSKRSFYYFIRIPLWFVSRSNYASK